MDFELTDEQKMVVDSVDKLLSDQYDFRLDARLSSNAFDSLFGSILQHGSIGYAIANRIWRFSASVSDLSALWTDGCVFGD